MIFWSLNDAVFDRGGGDDAVVNWEGYQGALRVFVAGLRLAVYH